jgi:UTP--glucose-1-phosphate uridylyltransferase
MIPPVRKAVFPVAGLGTRFLPATKASPKEMLPVVDKPIIQYAVEEAIAAGITDLIFVTGRTKRAIEDHFDRSPELELELAQRGRTQMLEQVRAMLPDGVNCIYIRQAEPLGLGHAVLCARPVVGNEPFAVVLPDDLIHDPGQGCVAQLSEQFARTGASLVAVEDVPADATDKYGIVSVDDASQRLSRMRGIVEKPAPAAAPSTLGVVGRYLLTPAIFEHLVHTPRGAGGEIQLTDAIASLLQHEPVDAFRFRGRRFDCGSKLGFLEATLCLALEHEDLRGPLRAILRAL